MIIRRDFLTEELDVDLLKRVDTAELVQLVVDLVEDEGLVVVGCVVLHYVIHCGGGDVQSEEGGTRHALRHTGCPFPRCCDRHGDWVGGDLGMMPGRVGCGEGVRWGRGGALQAGTCVWDQEVHHLDSVEVDHHTTAVGGSADSSSVSAELGNIGPLPGWWWYVCVCARVGLGRKGGGFMGVTGVWISRQETF